MRLNAFLLARIAEDEAAALRADPRADDGGSAAWTAEVDGPSAYFVVNRSRALAECEAKRRIVDAATSAFDEDWEQQVLRILVLPYADHPDYDDAWRP